MRIYIVAALMVVLYLLPWVVNPAASLTPNGYELAEWMSLHPVVRGGNPPLLPSLLLRLPLVCVALLLAFTTRRSVIAAAIVFIVSAGLLPPELLQATGNPNSSQQGALAIITLIGGAIGISGVLPRFRHWIATVIAVMGAVCCILGLVQGIDLMRGFNLPAQIGFGGAALSVVFLVVAYDAATRKQTGQR